MRDRMLWALKIAVLTYVGFGAVLYLAQRAFLYMPVGENPSRDVPVEWVDVDGAQLKVWTVVGSEPEAAVLYFGGNAEDVYYNAGDFRQHLPDATAYLVNYRGYGGSSGSPSEAALFADALALFDRLAERHARIAVVGRSLGSGIAVYLASQRPVHRLVLVTPHDSVLALAERHYPVYPVRLMLKDRYESVAYAADVAAPVLLLVAQNDGLIPPEHAQRLADALPAELVNRVEIHGSGHNGISGHPAYWTAIRTFLAR
ncbi:MAG: alpha/beta fold hydrolase [Gammaproteobacteria bacterium]|nr:alpha/beta fold hydrolase [Gammaproteobacteria bacterium]